jgi:hypothetical protein
VSSAHKLKSSAPALINVDENSSIKDDGTSIAVCESSPPDRVLDLALNHGFRHIVQSKGFEYQKELLTAEKIIADPTDFFRFPASILIAPDVVSEDEEKKLIQLDQEFESSTQKREILAKINEKLESRGLSQTLIGDVAAVADEFVTNALYNAPFVDPKTSVNPGINRLDTEVSLEEGKSGRLILAHSDKLLFVGCQDPYGSLNLTQYLNKIRKTYIAGAAATMNFGSGGAGLGSYIIFNAGSSLYFGVEASRVTLLCCALPLKMSYKSRVQLPKHLHIVSTSGGKNGI